MSENTNTIQPPPPAPLPPGGIAQWLADHSGNQVVPEFHIDTAPAPVVPPLFGTWPTQEPGDDS